MHPVSPGFACMLLLASSASMTKEAKLLSARAVTDPLLLASSALGNLLCQRHCESQPSSGSLTVDNAYIQTLTG